MLEDAIRFPTTADDWIQTVVIGGVLNLLGVLVLPILVVCGYLVRVVRAGAAGTEAPSFTDWGDLLVDGVKLFALGLAASLVVALPLALVAGVGGAAAGVTGSRVFAGVVSLGVLLGVGVAALVLGYVLPAAVANFAVEGSLAAALDVGAVFEGALSGEYATAWLLALLVGLVGNLIGGLLAALVVGVFVLFYTQVVVAYLLGRGFAAGLGKAPDTDTPTGRAVPPVTDTGGTVGRDARGSPATGPSDADGPAGDDAPGPPARDRDGDEGTTAADEGAAGGDREPDGRDAR